MKALIAIPAYNEEKTIQTVIRNIPTKIIGINSYEILVVDDGSKDNTAVLARAVGATVISNKRNKGVGAAFISALEYARKKNVDVLITIDADMQFNPQDIPKIAEPIISKKSDFVTATRFHKRKFTKGLLIAKLFGNKLLTTLINTLFRTRFTDTQSGFRAYSKEVILRLNNYNTFTYTQETFIDILHQGFRIVEVPLVILPKRHNGRSRVVKNTLDYGIRVLIILIRVCRDIWPLQFFGWMGITSFSFGTLIALVLFIRLLLLSRVYPFYSLVWVALTLIILGFLLIILALLADMFARIKMQNNEILYQLRKQK